jgi:hypothetical protein
LVAWAAAFGYLQQMPNNDSHRSGFAVGAKTPGFTAMGIFLFFGAVMASLAATTLLCRGTALNRIWDLNPTAYKQLVPLAGTVGILFVILGALALLLQESGGSAAVFGGGDWRS